MAKLMGVRGKRLANKHKRIQKRIRDKQYQRRRNMRAIDQSRLTARGASTDSEPDVRILWSKQ